MDQPRRSTRFCYPTIPEVVEVLSLAPPSLPWRMEAPARHRIRVLLVLQGMSWPRADWLGHSLVARARVERGVRQPQGWDSDNELAEWLPAHNCLVCDKPFSRRYPEQAFCHTKCADRWGEMEAWAQARVGVTGPPRCRYCNSYMEVDEPGQLYCNYRCKKRANIIEAYELADVDLGAKIAAARYARGLSQAELARRAGVTRAYISKIEIGAMPGTEDLRQQILNILELDPEAPIVELVRNCGYCGADIGHLHPNAEYCSSAHAKRAARRAGLEERNCSECSRPIDHTAN